MYRALLLDFYGTLVEEDDVVIARIVERIRASARRSIDSGEISSRWWRGFASRCSAAHGASFRSQREIELESLREVLRECESPLDAVELSEEQFEYWQHPEPIEGAAEFLRALDLPVCIVSNIETRDLESAIASLGWDLPNVVTSESCRSYKPRSEPFDSGLAILGVPSAGVLHVGDSIGSDVAGASARGLDCAWVNPRDRSRPTGSPVPEHVVAHVRDLLPLLG